MRRPIPALSLCLVTATLLGCDIRAHWKYGIEYDMEATGPQFGTVTRVARDDRYARQAQPPYPYANGYAANPYANGPPAPQPWQPSAPSIGNESGEPRWYQPAPHRPAAPPRRPALSGGLLAVARPTALPPQVARYANSAPLLQPTVDEQRAAADRPVIVVEEVVGNLVTAAIEYLVRQ